MFTVRLFQFFPLSAFLITSKQTGDWALAFKVGAATALLETLFLLWRKAYLDRFLLGINLFLFIGGVAFLLDIEAVEMAYGNLRETSLFIGLLIVGATTTVLSPRGFVNAQPTGENARRVRIASLILLLTTAAACAFSAANRGDSLLAGVVPFLPLIVTRKLLVSKYVNEGSAKTTV